MTVHTLEEVRAEYNRLDRLIRRIRHKPVKSVDRIMVSQRYG